MHYFDEAIAQSRQPDGTAIGHTSPAYANMIGPFGGITAAQAINAVLQHPERLGEPVSLTVNFCAALDDGPYTLITRAVRTNRSTQHWTVEIRQADQTVATATAFTAVRRQTWEDDEHRMPAAPAPGAVAQREGSNPVAWLDRYEMRFVSGSIPRAWDGSEHHDSTTRLWVRDTPPRQLDHASLTALCDVFFPRIWRRRATPVPIGTVSMTVYYHADSAWLRESGDGYVFAQAQAQGFRGGYFDQTAQLWNEQGSLIATTHQVVYYKE
jgi:acyl-CoA thioesterase